MQRHIEHIGQIDKTGAEWKLADPSRQDAYFEMGFDQVERRKALQTWIEARHDGDLSKERDALLTAESKFRSFQEYQLKAKQDLARYAPDLSTNDNDYVFITFILDNLPHGLIGLLVASFFAAALNAKAAELNALASCTTVDFYRHLIRPDASDQQSVRASKLFTAFWGLVALLFALFCHLSENLIQATNIISSLFYPVLLSLFLCGFFLKFITATPAFLGALSAQALVLTLYFTVPDSTLSYHPIGVAACITVATILQPLIGRPNQPQGFPVVTDPPASSGGTVAPAQRPE
jgi:Na+(H+)/acetate symporter ActP